MNTILGFTRELKKLRNLYDYSILKYSGKKIGKHLELLRELIFVRSISALEVFLIDNIKEVFTLTKEPFKKYGGSSSIENKNILSSKSLSNLHSIIINDLCRKLHGGGYSEIEKFYVKHFNINLSFIMLDDELSRYHEDRHLLVHKLGKTDKKYRFRYNTDIQKVVVSKEYLNKAIKNIYKFGKIVSNEIQDKINRLNSENKDKIERRVKISILKIKDGSSIIQRRYCFWANDQYIDMNDILIEYLKISDNSFEIVLGGNVKEVSNITKKLKNEKRRGILEYKIKEDIILIKDPFKIKSIKLTKDQVDEIKKSLPLQPWPTGIHKEIAKKIQVPNKQVSIVIQHLINEGIFKNQIDGKIIENE